jgi:hypothetical protein
LINFDQTLKEQGIGKYLGAAYEFTGEDVSIHYSRVIYDNIEYLLITLLMIAVISGIIIDKFAEIRQHKEDDKIDNNSRCFV